MGNEKMFFLLQFFKFFVVDNQSNKCVEVMREPEIDMERKGWDLEEIGRGSVDMTIDRSSGICLP